MMRSKIVSAIICVAVVAGTNFYQFTHWAQKRQEYDARIISLESQITGMGFERIHEAKKRLDRLGG